MYPTNPDSTSSSEEMDKFLNNENIKKLKLQAQFKEGGFNLEKSKLIKSGVYLAQEGYGNAKAKGILEESKEKVVTGNIPIKSDIDELNFKKDESNIKILLEEIKKVLIRLGEKVNEN